MKKKTIVKVSALALSDGLQKAQRVVRDKSVVPILIYLHMRVDAERRVLTVTGTDPDTTVEADVALMEADGNVSFCVEPAIADPIKGLCDQPLTIEVKAGEAGGVRVRVVHGSGVFEMAGTDDELYPDPVKPTGKGYEVDAGCLLNGLKVTSGFAKKDELRPVINGVYADLPGDGSMTLVATDLGNLSRHITRSVKGKEAAGFVVSSATAGVLQAVLKRGGGNVRMTEGRNVLLVEQGDVRVSGRRIEGRFPNYKAVFRDCAGCMIVEAEALKSALERLLGVANRAAATVHMEVKAAEKVMRMAAEDVDWERSGEETLKVDSDGDLSVNIDGKRVIRMLGFIEGDAVIRFTDGASGLQIEPLEQKEGEQLTMLTMPMYGK